MLEGQKEYAIGPRDIVFNYWTERHDGSGLVHSRSNFADNRCEKFWFGEMSYKLRPSRITVTLPFTTCNYAQDVPYSRLRCLKTPTHFTTIDYAALGRR